MKKHLKILVLALVLGLSACTSTDKVDDDQKVVYTTIYPVYDFTTKIAGDKIKVEQLIENNTDFHSWEPTARTITNVNDSAALIYNGAGLEHWLDDIKQSSDEDVLFVDTSQGVSLIKSDHTHEDGEEHHDDEEGHDELASDPHIWLSIENAKIQLKNIKDALISIDSENEAYYQANYEKWDQELNLLAEEYQTSLKDLSTREFAVSHEAFGYLAHENNLIQHGLAGIENEAEPTATRVAKMIDYINKHYITTIFYEDELNTKIADTIANETQATTAYLSPLEALNKEQIAANDDYFSVMRANLAALEKALK